MCIKNKSKINLIIEFLGEKCECSSIIVLLFAQYKSNTLPIIDKTAFNRFNTCVMNLIYYFQISGF